MTESTSRRDLNEDPQYFAYYLNKATANLFSILNEVGTILNSKLNTPKQLTRDTDDAIEQHPVLGKISNFSSDKNEQANISGLRWALLSKHLPFLKTYQYKSIEFIGRMTEKDAKKFKERNPNNVMSLSEIIATIPKLKDTVQFEEIELEKNSCIKDEIKIIIQLLRFLRNTYSHSHPEQKDKATTDILNQLELNKKYPFTLEKNLRRIWNAGILHSSDRVSYIKLRRYRHMIKGLPKHYFHHFLTQEKAISQNGIAYLICLFLEKKDAYQFLKKLRGFKQGGAKSKSFDNAIDAEEKQQSERFQATLHTYTAFCCQLPKPVIEFKAEYAESKIDLMTNMLNELQKCPKELFDMLQPKDQEEFAYSIRHDRLGNIEDNIAEQKSEKTTIDDTGLTTHSYLIRHRDRFPYFALRFIEETQLFSGIKFHIDYGKMILSHTFQDQEGNITYDHSWTKDVRDFGLLSHAQQHRLSYQLGLQKGETPQKYAASHYEYFSPHYHIDNNQIQFLIDITATSDEVQIPSRMTTDPKKDKDNQKFIGKSLVKNTYQGRKYVLSTFDLASLIQLKLSVSDFDLQQHLQTLETNYLRFLKDAVDGTFQVNDYNELGIKLKAYQLKRHWIPKEVKRCLAKHTLDYQKHIKDQIEAEKKDTQARLHILNDKKKLNPKIGTMADFLAQDIIKRMLPKSTLKAKISPEQYQQLQRNFALFSTEQVDA
ncbi:type VI-B CRISPR-associated RNA-guided ribonuclease Cas13b, partial [Aquimarina rhabdastrellae]